VFYISFIILQFHYYVISMLHLIIQILCNKYAFMVCSTWNLIPNFNHFYKTCSLCEYLRKNKGMRVKWRTKWPNQCWLVIGFFQYTLGQLFEFFNSLTHRLSNHFSKLDFCYLDGISLLEWTITQVIYIYIAWYA